MEDFLVHKFYSYTGPNYYIDRQAMVFNLYLDPEGPGVEFYKDRVLEKFPDLEAEFPEHVVDLFAMVLVQVYKMDMNLFVRRHAIHKDNDEWVIAIEHLDDKLAKECIYFVSDWFFAMTEGTDQVFDFNAGFEALQGIFNKTIFGGPTIYSLIEGGIKRKINVHYLYEENQFQWGYGKKQVRGRSTIFHVDGIKDTEFTSFKDMVGEWLELCGFPTPKGVNCFEEEEVVIEALKLGFPCVVKPVAGHKGQGVTTGIESEIEVRKAFKRIVDSAVEHGTSFDGALVQQQIYGYDHRILTIGGKYTACLKRVPAYVIGNGVDTITELIRVENEKEVRIDNARSPLAKIKLDDDMKDFLKLQGKTPKTIPADGEEVVLRRVANISAGGVSINVTNDIHPKNIEMVENIAKFLNVVALGIDVLAQDISKPWDEGNFGIIEINAGPGVFMHLAPAIGGSVDVPGKIMEHLFGKIVHFDRIPIIAGNKISDKLIEKIYKKLCEFKKDVEFGSIRSTGVFFNNCQFTNNPRHDSNCQILLRNPKLDFAVFNHNSDQIHDFGIWHQGMDIAILENANYAEEILKRDIMPDGLVIEIIASEKEDGTIVNEFIVTEKNLEIFRKEITKKEKVDDLIFEIIEPKLKELLFKYDYYLKLENTPENLDIDRVFVKEQKLV
jgi:cyanophycin synthetase